MSIKSHAFGRVTLTGDDASKFQAQVTYGRPKPEAHESARRGREMIGEFARDGKATVRLPIKK